MTTIQIRNVPEDMSRELKSRAAAEGKSLSEFLLEELGQIAARPSRRAVLDRIEARGRLDLPPVAEILRDEREQRP